jgi:hypothetical protein
MIVPPKTFLPDCAKLQTFTLSCAIYAAAARDFEQTKKQRRPEQISKQRQAPEKNGTAVA